MQRIVAELEEGGYLVRAREGRRNRYVLREGPPRHDMDLSLPLRELLGIDDSPRVGPASGTPRDPSFLD